MNTAVPCRFVGGPEDGLTMWVPLASLVPLLTWTQPHAYIDVGLHTYRADAGAPFIFRHHEVRAEQRPSPFPPVSLEQPPPLGNAGDP